MLQGEERGVTRHFPHEEEEEDDGYKNTRKRPKEEMRSREITDRRNKPQLLRTAHLHSIRYAQGRCEKSAFYFSSQMISGDNYIELCLRNDLE